MSGRYIVLFAVWLIAGGTGYFVRSSQRARTPVKSPGIAAAQVPAWTAAEVLGRKAKAAGSPFLDQLAAAGVGDMRRIFAEYDAITDPSEREDAIRLLIARWVELGPEDALKFFVGRNQRPDIRNVLVQWAMLDPSAAAASVAEGTAGVRMLSEVWSKLAHINGKFALRFLLASPEGPELTQVFASGDIGALENLGRADFEGSLELINRLAGEYKLRAQAILAAGFAANDPDGALKRVRELKNVWALSSVLGKINETDPDKARREWDNSPELKSRITAGSSEEFLIASIAGQLGKTDPSGALEWLNGEIAGAKNALEIKQGAASMILKDAVRDPSRLAEVFPAILGDLDAKDFFFPSYAPAAVLPEALEAVSALPPGQARDWLLANLAGQEGSEDPLGSLRWLEQITDASARQKFVKGISNIYNQEKTDLARELYSALPPDLKGGVVDKLAEAQARQNGPAAVDWVQSLPDAADRQKAMVSALTVWTRSESAEASIWVDALPPGPDRDAAAAGLVQGIAVREPSSAFAWALSIGDPGQQFKSLETAIEHWGEADPAAASTAVRGASLPEARKGELIKLISPDQLREVPGK